MPTSSLGSLRTYVDRRLRAYAVSATIGFVIILCGVAYAVHETSQAGLANSELICGIVLRLEQANAANFERGVLGADERARAKETYAILQAASKIDCSDVALPIDMKR